MFKQRLLTTLVLVPLVLLGIYFANATAVFYILLALMFACAYESIPLIPLWPVSSFFKICPCTRELRGPKALKQRHVNDQQRLTKGLVNTLYLFLLFILVGLFLRHILFFNWLGCIAWLFAACLIVFHARLEKCLTPWIVGLLLCIFLPLFVASLYQLYLHAQGNSLLVYLLLLVWACDIGAYVVGKQWGKRRLIPAVSPGKTWEGMLGGLIASQMIAIAAYGYFFNILPLSMGYWMLKAAMIFIIALIGDLFISLLKRRVKIKDTGSLLPGHGGLLDRLDSLIATAPIYYLLMHGSQQLG